MLATHCARLARFRSLHYATTNCASFVVVVVVFGDFFVRLRTAALMKSEAAGFSTILTAMPGFSECVRAERRQIPAIPPKKTVGRKETKKKEQFLCFT